MDTIIANEILFKSFTNLLGLLTSLISIIIFFPLYIKAYSIAKNKFEKLYPDEKVLHVIKNSNFLMFLVTFIFGYFLGCNILPFFIFNDLNAYDIVNRQNVYFYLIVVFASFWLLLFRFSLIIVISDKRLKWISAYNIYEDKIQDSFSPLYSDMISTKYSSFLGIEQTVIEIKNNKHFIINSYKDLKLAKNIIDKQMKGLA